MKWKETVRLRNLENTLAQFKQERKELEISIPYVESQIAELQSNDTLGKRTLGEALKQESMDKDMKPPQFTDAMDETAISLLMMRWLNSRGCAVVVWTKKELRGLNPQDIEGTLIECGSEAIYALTGEMNTSDEDSTEEETQ